MKTALFAIVTLLALLICPTGADAGHPDRDRGITVSTPVVTFQINFPTIDRHRTHRRYRPERVTTTHRITRHVGNYNGRKFDHKSESRTVIVHSRRRTYGSYKHGSHAPRYQHYDRRELGPHQSYRLNLPSHQESVRRHSYQRDWSEHYDPHVSARITSTAHVRVRHR